MTCGASPKLQAYTVLLALGLLGSLTSGRPEPAVIAAPFAVALAVGLARGAPSQELGVTVTVDPRPVPHSAVRLRRWPPPCVGVHRGKLGVQIGLEEFLAAFHRFEVADCKALRLNGMRAAACCPRRAS